MTGSFPLPGSVTPWLYQVTLMAVCLADLILHSTNLCTWAKEKQQLTMAFFIKKRMLPNALFVLK